MSITPRVAILLDGGFVRAKLEGLNRSFPSASDVIDLTSRIMAQPRLIGADLLRIFFYDAPPLSGSATNPLSGKAYNFGSHETHTKNHQLQESLAQAPDVAVRRGEAVFRGWKLRQTVLTAFAEGTRKAGPLDAKDLAPDIQQKGVDLRIGLDVALLSIKRIVDTIVLVTGDADMVPAMKFARREGLRVYLDTMGHGVRPLLTEHADYVFNSSSP